MKKRDNMGFGIVEYIIVFAVVIILLSVFHKEVEMCLYKMFLQICEIWKGA
jgi:Tfp pilus assembly protein PilE